MSDADQQGKRERGAGGIKCSICGQAVDAEAPTFPFCSKRCRQIDLGKWLKGDYLISRPIEEGDLDEGE